LDGINPSILFFKPAVLSPRDASAEGKPYSIPCSLLFLGDGVHVAVKISLHHRQVEVRRNRLLHEADDTHAPAGIVCHLSSVVLQMVDTIDPWQASTF
jgi:hypothetical protein